MKTMTIERIYNSSLDSMARHAYISPIGATAPTSTKEEHVMTTQTTAPRILNLTQHPATPEQIAAGVIDLTGADLVELRAALTFDVLPTIEEVMRRAWRIARLAHRNGAEAAMIGGAPYLTRSLEGILHVRRVKPLYAFSVRETVEERMPDGSIRKTSVFRHAGFVPTY